MSADKLTPQFGGFTQWLASRPQTTAATAATAELLRHSTVRTQDHYPTLLKAAHAARDEVLCAPPAQLEILQLLAASGGTDSSRPPELTTARGFRVILAYDEGGATTLPSICVLVKCPAELISAVEGKTVFLWAGADRFPLGDFDSEGKAIGTLPAGIDIAPSDFASGRVKLEEPPAPTDR